MSQQFYVAWILWDLQAAPFEAGFHNNLTNNNIEVFFLSEILFFINNKHSEAFFWWGVFQQQTSTIHRISNCLACHSRRFKAHAAARVETRDLTNSCEPARENQLLFINPVLLFIRSRDRKLFQPLRVGQRQRIWNRVASKREALRPVGVRNPFPQRSNSVLLTCVWSECAFWTTACRICFRFRVGLRRSMDCATWSS